MKKFFITLIAFCGLALQANADVTLAVGSTTLIPGEDGAVSIILKSDKPVTAFSAVVALPEGVTFTGDLELTAAGESLKGDGGIGGGSIEGGTKMNVVAYGLNPASGEIVIGTAPVAVAASVSATTLVVVTDLKSQVIVGYDEDDEPITENNTEATVEAGEGEDVITTAEKMILDENSKGGVFEYTGDITVKRTINANEWSTICLPFEIDPEDLAAAIGGDVEVAEFSGNEVDEDGNMIVSFDAAEYMDANTPYIIKTSVKVEEFDLSEIEVSPDEAIVEVDNGKKGNNRIVSGAFVGTFYGGIAIPMTVALQNKKESVNGATLFISGNKFYWTAENSKPIKAFRGYFAFSEDVRDAEVKFVVNGETTRINEVQNNVVKNSAIYDLSGKQVRNNNLKGVFIQNGKKVVK